MNDKENWRGPLLLLFLEKYSGRGVFIKVRGSKIQKVTLKNCLIETKKLLLNKCFFENLL
jgi:hypothetical protein